MQPLVLVRGACRADFIQQLDDNHGLLSQGFCLVDKHVAFNHRNVVCVDEVLFPGHYLSGVDPPLDVKAVLLKIEFGEAHGLLLMGYNAAMCIVGFTRSHTKMQAWGVITMPQAHLFKMSPLIRKNNWLLEVLFAMTGLRSGLDSGKFGGPWLELNQADMPPLVPHKNDPTLHPPLVKNLSTIVGSRLAEFPHHPG